MEFNPARLKFQDLTNEKALAPDAKQFISNGTIEILLNLNGKRSLVYEALRYYVSDLKLRE